jgi:hypothetical protein
MVNKRKLLSVVPRLLLLSFVCAFIFAVVSNTSANAVLDSEGTPEALVTDDADSERDASLISESTASLSDEDGESPAASNGDGPVVAVAVNAAANAAAAAQQPQPQPQVRDFIRVNMTFPDGKNKVTGTFIDDPLKGCTFEGTITSGSRNGNYRIVGNVTVTCNDKMKSTFVLRLNLSYPEQKIKNENGVYPAGNISVVANSGTGQFAGIAAGAMNVESQIFPTDKGGKSIFILLYGFPPKAK